MTINQLIETTPPSDPTIFTTELYISSLYHTENEKEPMLRNFFPLSNIEHVNNGAKPTLWCLVIDTDWHKSNPTVHEVHPYACMIELDDKKAWITTYLE